MYQCRATNFAENQKYFICSTYRKGKDLCTTHSIKNVVLHEIVLRNLREAISYVSEHEAEFIQDAAETITGQGCRVRSEALKRWQRQTRWMPSLTALLPTV